MVGAAVGLGAIAFLDPALLPALLPVMTALVAGGAAMEAGAIAQALTQNRGMGITVRQPAAFRQIVYGEQRVGGVSIYQSTTGGKHDQYNYIIVLATHEIDSILNLYLDGRQVFWDTTNYGNSTRNGVNFGGSADGNDHIGPGGNHYNFGTLVYCEARWGDQAEGDVIGAMTANDPNWAATEAGSPWVGGCAYVYLKVEFDTAMFPQQPEIRFTVRGKNNVFDPRTGGTGYTTNAALIQADVLTDATWGLGDNSVNQAQLIAAANVCDEQVALAAGATANNPLGTEARYACHYHYDTSVGPGDVLQQMMPACAGRLSRIGGEWFIWPAYWQGPSFEFDENALVDRIQWTPNRSYRDLWNYVTGTYIAPNYPYNAAGNLYDTNGWYEGTTQDNFPFAFQPTNYPQYAQDVLHGYSSNALLAADGGVYLPHEVVQNCVLSVAQAQRVAKIMLLRNRQQGSGVFPMSLAALQMQPTDVMQFTFAAAGWTGKYLEIDSMRFKAEAQDAMADDGEHPPRIYVECSVIETAEAVYEWSTSEELTVYDVPAAPPQSPYIVDAPTGFSVVSSDATALIAEDGVVTPRALLSWTAPTDILSRSIQIQFQAATDSGWTDAGTVDAATTQAYVAGVVSGAEYNFQIRSIRNNGAQSAWAGFDAVTIGAPSSGVAATSAPATGILIPDTVNGHTYKIQVTDGAVALTMVS